MDLVAMLVYCIDFKESELIVDEIMPGEQRQKERNGEGTATARPSTIGYSCSSLYFLQQCLRKKNVLAFSISVSVKTLEKSGQGFLISQIFFCVLKL